MATPNTDLMGQSWKDLSGRWGLAIGTMIVFFLITAVSGIIPLASLILSGPLAVGYAIFNLRLARKQNADLSNIFDGFNNFGTNLAAFLLMLIYIIGWTLLLIIPGIIKAMSYSQTFFIIAQEPNIGANEAIEKSMKMMDGYKLKYFGLQLLFMLCASLTAVTLFIGMFWVAPWMQVTLAKFHDDISEKVSLEGLGENTILNI